MENKEIIEPIRGEAKRIEYLCLWAAERHYAAETPWYYLNYWLGIPSTISAALAGAIAASKQPYSEWIAAGIALFAAVLTSLLTFLDPYKKASIHHTLAKNYESLYHAAGFFLRFESVKENTDPQEIEKKLYALVTRFNELLQSSPAIPGHAYKTAEHNIKGGEGEVLRVHEDQSHTGQ